MELQDDILKSFSDAINGANTPSTEGQRSVYATAVEDESGLYVRFDGSEVNTPAISMVECGNGDRVLATWKGHTAVITGNISYPSLTRKGSIYMTMTDDGLVIGTLDENNQPAGYYILIRPADDSQPGVEIIDTQGRVVSHFGLYSSIGFFNGARVLANNSGVTVYNKDAINSAFYGDYIRLGKVSGSTYLGPHVFLNANGLEICNTANTIQANFYSDWARIGYLANQHINITTNSVDVCEYTNGQEVSVAKLAAQARIGKESGEHVLVTANTVDIKKGSTVYATFGATTTVGVPTGRHITIGSSTIDVYKDSSNVYASFGDTARIGLSSKGHVKIDQSSVNVYTGSESSSGTLVASFGSTTTIGPTNSRHVQITSSGVNIRYANTNVASFTDTAVTLAQGAAQFSTTTIRLGTTDSSQIYFCNGKAGIKYNTSSKYFLIGATPSTKAFSVSNSGNGAVCTLALNTDPSDNYTVAALQVSQEGTSDSPVIPMEDPTTFILNRNGIFANTDTSGSEARPFYFNGSEVATVNDLYTADSTTFSVNMSGYTRRTVATNFLNIPNGYTLVGVTSLRTDVFGIDVIGWSCNTSAKQISVRLRIDSNITTTTCTVTVGWFAIRSKNKTSVTYPTKVATWWMDDPY